MKKHLVTAAFLLAASTITMAQTPFSVTSTFPSNAATSVDLETTIRFTFNEPIPIHLTANDLEEFVEVSPRSDIQIHASSFSEDRRSLVFDVTHNADRDFHWTVTGPFPIDRFHLLSYTTATAFGTASVSGQLTLPEDAELSTFKYGYVLLTPFSNLSFWDELPRYAGIATLNQNGTFDITGVRPGTYYAYAIVTSDPADEETAAVYFGKHDQQIVVQNSSIQNVAVTMQSLDNFFPVSHSHTKLEEIRGLVNSASPNSGLKSVVGFQMLQNNDVPDGSSIFWTYMWHDHITEKSFAATMSGGFVDFEEVEDQSLSGLMTLPLTMITSSQAVDAVMQAGAAQFVDRMPEDAMIIVMQMAGIDITQYGYEGVIPNGPFWFINIVSVYSSPEGSVTEVHYALVDAMSGAIINQTPTSIEKDPSDEGLVKSISLSQNYPNPFNPTTEIGYQISEIGRTRLSVYDLLGREVAVLVDGVMPAGEHRVSFDASGLSSGVYLYRLQSGSMVETRRMTLVK